MSRKTLQDNSSRLGHSSKTSIQIHYQRPKMTNYQTAILDSDKRFTATTASTKVGKTYSHYVWLFEEALKGKHGHNYWWVAPVRGQAKIAFTRLKEGLTAKNEKQQRVSAFEENLTELKLTIKSIGTHIWFKSADKPDSLYGDDVYAAVFDEFTRAKDSAWHALYSTLTFTGGKCKLIGNVKGRGWGHDLVVNAQTGIDDWKHFKVTALDAVNEGILDQKIVEQARRDLSADKFMELYMAEPPKDGDNPFGFDYISEAITEIYGSQPLYFGIDLAKSVDYTVIIGLDRNGQMSHLQRFRHSWTNTINIIKGIIDTYPNAIFYIDSTGVGDPIVEALESGRKNIQRFQFTETSRQQILEGLALNLQQKRIKIFSGVNTHEIIPEEDRFFLKKELENFEYAISTGGKVKYRVKSGHDDGVMALALACKAKASKSFASHIDINPTTL